MRWSFVVPLLAVAALSACQGEVNNINRNPGADTPGQVFTGEERGNQGPVIGSTQFCDPNNYTDILGEDQSIVDEIVSPGQIRIINPGDNVDPTDFIEDRLNVSIREDGSIRAVSCG